MYLPTDMAIPTSILQLDLQFSTCSNERNEMREKVFFSHITAAGFSHTFYDTSFLLGLSLSNVYRSMTTMHARRRRRSAKASLNHGRIVQHVQPASLVHVCEWHNHNTSPSSAESLPRLLPLLITPLSPESFQLLLSTLLPQHQCHDS